MTTTSDRDGRTPTEPGTAFPPSPDLPSEADDHPTVVLTPYGELPAYSHDNVLPSGPVGGGRRAARVSTTPERRSGPTPLGRVVIPAAVALVSGVALVFGWSTLQDNRAETAAQSQPTTRATAPAAPVASTSPKAVASSSPKAVASSSPSTAARPAASAASSPAAAAAVDRSVPVVILNATARTGLAAKVAAQLRKLGWTVVAVGNYRTRLAATTVFAEGHADAVATMRGDLPTPDALKPPLGAMNPARITVVVGPDYPRG
jgi:hypothetical protein